jgi:hypothetical protein
MMTETECAWVFRWLTVGLILLVAAVLVMATATTIAP